MAYICEPLSDKLEQLRKKAPSLAGYVAQCWKAYLANTSPWMQSSAQGKKQGKGGAWRKRREDN